MYSFKGKTVAKLAALLIAGGLGGAGINALHNVATYGNTVTVAHADAVANGFTPSANPTRYELIDKRGQVTSLSTLDTSKTGLTGISIYAPKLESTAENTQKIQDLINNNKASLTGVSIVAPIPGSLDLSNLSHVYGVNIVNTQLKSLHLTGLNTAPLGTNPTKTRIAVVGDPLMSPDYLKGLNPANLEALGNSGSNPDQLTVPTIGGSKDGTPFYGTIKTPTGLMSTPTNLIIGATTNVGIPYVDKAHADATIYANEPSVVGGASVPAGTVYNRQKSLKSGDLLAMFKDSNNPSDGIDNLQRSYQMIFGELLGTDAGGTKVVTDVKDVPLAKLLGQVQTQTGGGEPQALTDAQKKAMTVTPVDTANNFFTYDKDTQTLKFTGDKNAYLAYIKHESPDSQSIGLKYRIHYSDAAGTNYTGTFAFLVNYDVAPTPSSNGGGGSTTPTTNNGGNTNNPVTYPTVTGQTGLGSGVLVPGTNVREGQAVYATRGIYLYSNPTFSKKYRKVHYNKQRRVNRPMFVVTGYTYSKNGALRYKVKDVNHTWKSDGKTGYITASTKYVVPVYYTSLPKSRVITVINAHGINAYKSVNLKGKATHYKKGRHLRVVKVVKHNLTSRYVLSNGQYITANKKLIIAGNY